MARLIFAVLAAVTAVLSVPSPGMAFPYYPWCSVSFDRAGHRQCYHASYAQCMATVSGIGGYCEKNAPGPAAAEARPAKPRHR